MGAVDLDSGEERDSKEVEESSPEEQDPPPPSPSSQLACSVAGKSHTEDPLSHYQSPTRNRPSDDMWELYFQFDGAKFVQISMPRSDIRFLNLLSVMEKEGYGMCDSLYYVKDEGEGLNGLALVDRNLKVEEMVRKYEHARKLVLTVMRDKRKLSIVVSPVKPFGRGRSPDEDEVDEEKTRKEAEELQKTVAELRRKRTDPLEHCEGETDVEDIFDTPSVNYEDMLSQMPVKKKPRRQGLMGPTLRSHSQLEEPVKDEWAPSDEEDGLGFLAEEDDDGHESLPFMQPKGRKSRAKKQPERTWYDENRYMCAAKIKHENTFCIKKMHLEHSCPTEPKDSRVDSRWLSNAYVDKFRSDPNTSITTLVDKAKKDFGVDVPKRMAYRAMTRARNVVMGDHKKQYHRLRDYLQTVIDRNPRSRCIVTTVTGPTEDELEEIKKGQQIFISEQPRFHGLFFCVNAAKQGFLDGCRPFLGLDGCFTKLTTGAHILAATGRDGNNNIYPVAWAVVAKEDTQNWQWFLEQLKEALGGEQGKFGYYTIMSDRQKGLLKAVTIVFPNCAQRYCLRHIYANLQTAGFRGEYLKKCMDNAAYSYTKHGFHLAMEEMKKQSEPAWAWLTKIPVQAWAGWAMGTNCKTDLVVNNLSEVFNRYILDVRNKPIVTMFTGIYEMQMVRHDGKREGADKASWEIAPHYAEKLELMKTFSKKCTAIRADVGLWQKGNVHEQLYPSILSHAQEHGWTKTQTPDIMPPGFKDHMKGRRQEKRTKNKFEVPKPKVSSRMATVRCGNCKLQGHKWTSCSMPLRADLSTRRMPEEASGAAGPSATTSPSAPRPSAPEPSARAAPSAPGPSARAAPSAAARSAPSEPARPDPSHAPRMMGYFTAGANASAGRDASVPPLATSRNYGAPGQTYEEN
ncbi:uncharacterized protein LOC124655949 [Lolium rigidum]|uniref:uncharacterized protein LOC124655949 n=1 Tax=Lolium rigidum TaxID=89674 RepID=UPI001F5E0697|nr:uncharacterized protein LOC124655949 [Lolium rigidum]